MPKYVVKVNMRPNCLFFSRSFSVHSAKIINNFMNLWALLEIHTRTNIWIPTLALDRGCSQWPEPIPFIPFTIQSRIFRKKRRPLVQYDGIFLTLLSIVLLLSKVTLSFRDLFFCWIDNLLLLSLTSFFYCNHFSYCRFFYFLVVANELARSDTFINSYSNIDSKS